MEDKSKTAIVRVELAAFNQSNALFDRATWALYCSRPNYNNAV